MAITRGQMQRQLRRGGGIMNIAPREQFGLGSSFKKFVRKVIPNEVSKVATIAAPFVAPFNPALAATMAGVGSFDQTGSLSKALKSGALTYGGGQAARFIGGAGFQGNPLNEPLISSPLGTDTGIGKILSDRAAAKGQALRLEGVKGIGSEGLTGSDVGGNITLAESAGGTSASPTILAEQMSEASLTPRTITETITKSDSKTVTGLLKNKKYGEAAKLAAEKGLKSIFTTPITDSDGNVTGSKLDKTALLAAGSFGLSYVDAKKLADDAGVDIGTESEYDEATKAEKKEEYASYLTNFFGGRKDGGRIGFKDGYSPGIVKKALKKYNSVYGIDVSGEEILVKDLYSGGFDEFLEIFARDNRAQGGRIGFADGTDKKLKEILEMDMTIPKSRNDPRNMTTNEILFAIEDGRATPEMFEELLLRDVGGISTLMLDEIGGKKLDEPKKVYEFNPSESRQGGAIENLLFKLRESNPDIYGEYFRPRSEKDIGYRDKPLMAKGGRIGYMFGDRVKDDEGIMSMSDEKDENMKMAYFPGDVFSKAEISRLFSDRSLTTNQDRKDLYKILMNPGMYPEAEDMLKRLLRGKQDGGRIGFNSGSRDLKDYKFMELFDEESYNKKLKEKEDLINELMDKGYRFDDIMQLVSPRTERLMDDGTYKQYGDAPSISLGKIGFNMGGEVPVRKNKAGIEELDYRQTGGFVPVGVKEKADDVPAMLSKNEFVLTADAVRGIGGGDVEKGAEKLYGVMKQAEKVGRA